MSLAQQGHTVSQSQVSNPGCPALPQGGISWAGLLPLIWKGMDWDSFKSNLPGHPADPLAHHHVDSSPSAPSTSHVSKLERLMGSEPLLSALRQPAVTFSKGSAFLSSTYRDPAPSKAPPYPHSIREA